jgi:multiple sugar transport system substrate-binding protein
MANKNYSRRDFLRITALGTASMAAATSGLKIAQAGSTFRSRSGRAAAATVSLIDPWSGAPDLNKAQIAQINRFMESHPNIKIERSDIVFGDFIQLLVQNAAARELPDIALIDNPNFHGFAALGVLTDLTDKVKSWGQADKYFPGHWATTVYDKANYGVPVFSNCLAWWVNTDMTKAAGVKTPTTWEELKASAKALTDKDRYALAVSGIHNEEGAFQFLAFLWSAGSDLATINDAGGQEALQLWVDLVKNGNMSKGMLGWDQGAVKDEFGNGRAAMMLNGPWMIPSMKKDYAKVNWEIAQIPKSKVFSSILGGENYGICKGSKNEDAAWEYISWTQEPENYKQFLKDAGMFPSRSDVAEDAYWTKDPVLNAFLENVKVARARAYGANYVEMSNALQDAIQAAVTGQSSVKDALDKAAKIITPLLPK